MLFEGVLLLRNGTEFKVYSVACWPESVIHQAHQLDQAVLQLAQSFALDERRRPRGRRSLIVTQLAQP